LEDRSDACDVVLVVEHARLERSPLLRLESGARPAVRNRHRCVEAQHAVVVLRLPGIVLLPPGLTGMRPRRHEDSGLGTVTTRAPGALPARDVACPIELGSVLAEVPDVPEVVLRVPVRRPLAELPTEIQAVVDDHARGAVDRDRAPRDGHDVARGLSVLDPAVDVDGPRDERVPAVRDVRVEHEYEGRGEPGERAHAALPDTRQRAELVGTRASRGSR